MLKYKIEDLIENIKKYNDTVLVIGKDVVETDDFKIFSVDESSKDIFNRKTLIKNPDIYWSFYFSKLPKNRDFTLDEFSIEKLIKNIGDVRIINNTYTSLFPGYCNYPSLNISGDFNVLTCIKNHHEISTDKFLSTAKENNYSCPECGSKIKPSVLMYGETYDPYMLDKLNKMISKEEDGEIKPNTHNIFFIGADFDDDIINDIMISFKSLKNKYETDDEKFFTIMINKGKNIEIERYEPDFATSDTINDSINRLIEKFE